MKRNYLSVIITYFAIALCSCSSAEEPSPEKSGEEIATRFKSLFLNNGEMDLFPLVAGGDEYMTPCGNEDQALSLCRSLLEEVDKKDSGNRYILPDGYGSIRIMESETDGIYFTLIFNVTDIPPFTMHITSDDFFENANNGIRFTPIWKCTKCGKEVVMKQRPSTPCCSGGAWILAGKSRIPIYA